MVGEHGSNRPVDWAWVYAIVRRWYGVDVGDLTYSQLVALLEKLPDMVKMEMEGKVPWL